MRGVHLLAHAVVGFAHQLVGHALLGEVGLGQLLAVAVQLALEGLRGVEALFLGFQHLEAEIGVQVQVVGHALAGAIVGRRAVVFAVHVGKLVGRNRVVAQGFDGRARGVAAAVAEAAGLEAWQPASSVTAAAPAYRMRLCIVKVKETMAPAGRSAAARA